MAIDTLLERPIPLTQASRLIPRRRAGRKCSVVTLYRWSAVGCRGVVLVLQHHFRGTKFGCLASHVLPCDSLA